VEVVAAVLEVVASSEAAAEVASEAEAASEVATWAVKPAPASREPVAAMADSASPSISFPASSARPTASLAATINSASPARLEPPAADPPDARPAHPDSKRPNARTRCKYSNRECAARCGSAFSIIKLRSF